jgi:tetratricopeptide (TPR) repeat protein
MRRMTIVIGILTTFGLGLALGLAWAKKTVDESLYVGAPPDAAASALLELAEEHAGRGSWERIHVARVYFLSGDPERGQAIFDAIIDRKVEASDWVRMGRIYHEAGDWESAQRAFEKVIDLEPDDEDWMAAIGSYYNLHGDRARAEELFRRSFQDDPDDHWNLANAAGSYVGVDPQW